MQIQMNWQGLMLKKLKIIIHKGIHHIFKDLLIDKVNKV